MVYFCCMRSKIYFIIVIILAGGSAKAQKKWNLQQCIEYAMTNNITIKQTDLQTKLSELQYKQSKLGQYPAISFSGGPAYNSGRNQDPTTVSLITQSYVSTNLQLQSSAQIFNWYSKRNTIAANEWELQAAKAATDKLKNDIALTVANAYLQILLAKEQEKIAGVQLQQSQAQLSNTRKLVDAGALPELNASELEAQVARDSSTLISAKGSIELNILNLKAYMAIDAAAPFEVDTPPVEMIPVEKISDLQPEAVFALAMANMPQQRVNDFKLKAAKKDAAAAKAGMYPTISVYGSLGSGYNSRAEDISSTSQSNTAFGKVTVGGIDYNVYPFVPFTSYNYDKTAFFHQLNENFRQSVGLNLSVPIFNGSSLRTAYEKSKVNTRNQELQKELDDQKLKQDIYQAYNAAMVAMEKFNADKKSLQTAERSFSFAQKRYDVGMLSTLDLITNQNNLFSVKLQYALDQFDYVFKMKVLEFYKGQGLKL
jgi:outer membrane protein